MKSHKISSGLKHLAGVLMSCLVFCSMFSQCEQERSLEEGNDVDFTLFGLSSFPEGLLLYSTGATSVEFEGKSLSCDVPLLSVAEEEASAPDFISITGTFSCDFTLMLPDGSGEAMTECECHADKGYFNIFLL